jgi:flagellar hook protein FlgE
MGLSSTLFTGLSGLSVNQAKLNVVGNNIANVNTVAFKSSRALFAPQFYITDSPGGEATDGFGGTNPSQRGLGAVVSSVQKNFSAGAIEPTGQATDMAIAGDGFFIVQGQEQTYTRDGSFRLNSEHELVSQSGGFVQGYGVDATGNVASGAVQNLTIPLGTLTRAKATENISLSGILNAGGALTTGASILNSEPLTNLTGTAAPTGASALVDLRRPGALGAAIFTAGDTLTLTAKQNGTLLPNLSYTIDATSTVQNLTDFFNQGLGIDTSATIAGTPTPGASIAADTTDITGTTGRLVIVANAGKASALTLSATGLNISPTSSLTFADGQDFAGNVSNAVGESQSTSIPAYDSLGNLLDVNLTMTLVSRSNSGTTWQFVARSADDTDAKTFDPTTPSNGMLIGGGTLSFDGEGTLVSSANTTIQVTRNNTGASSPVNISLDFSRMTALNNGNHPSQVALDHQDGEKIGTLTSFSVGQDGVITGSFDNGLTGTLGQVAVATFKNSQGLVDLGGNMYATGASSGPPTIGAPLSGVAGEVRAGALEQSNVDLSEEFINMIVASTGFSAASRVISTSDQLIQELLNSSR